jgi:hypothetical protein
MKRMTCRCPRLSFPHREDRKCWELADAVLQAEEAGAWRANQPGHEHFDSQADYLAAVRSR